MLPLVQLNIMVSTFLLLVQLKILVSTSWVLVLLKINGFNILAIGSDKIKVL